MGSEMCIRDRLCSTKAWSSPTSPNSLMITATFFISFFLSKAESKVVLPLPRKPVITVTGLGANLFIPFQLSFLFFTTPENWPTQKLKTNVIIKINDATHTIEGPVGVSKT